MTNIKAAIFDLDGTLLDSMGIWGRIDEEFLSNHNIPIPSDFSTTICTMSFIQGAKYTKDRFFMPETVDEIIAEWKSMAEYEYSHNIKLFPFVKEYLNLLKSKGIKLAVATSLSSELYMSVLELNGISDMFDFVCSVDDVQKDKEFPDIFLFAAENLAVSPSECIVFDDILPAIRSAKTAGMFACGIYDEYSDGDSEQIKAIADIYIKDFSELLHKNTK